MVILQHGDDGRLAADVKKSSVVRPKKGKLKLINNTAEAFRFIFVPKSN